MPRHLVFRKDGFQFAMTGNAITIYDISAEKKVNQYFYPSLEEALYMFRAMYRTFCSRW